MCSMSWTPRAAGMEVSEAAQGAAVERRLGAAITAGWLGWGCRLPAGNLLAMSPMVEEFGVSPPGSSACYSWTGCLLARLLPGCLQAATRGTSGTRRAWQRLWPPTATSSSSATAWAPPPPCSLPTWPQRCTPGRRRSTWPSHPSGGAGQGAGQGWQGWSMGDGLPGVAVLLTACVHLQHSRAAPSFMS